jgi:hypothetical protein
MIVKQFVKWIAAGALALGAIPAIGMAHPRASLPVDAVSVTPTSMLSPASLQTTHRVSHARSTTHRVSRHRHATSQHGRARTKHTAAHSRRTAVKHKARAAAHRTHTRHAAKGKSAPRT